MQAARSGSVTRLLHDVGCTAYFRMMTVVISTEWDGQRRRLYPRTCASCGTGFYAPKHVKAKYCSNMCNGFAKRNRETFECAFCGQRFQKKPSSDAARTGLRFCTRSCKDKAQRIEGLQALHLPHYRDGRASYRKKAFQELALRCGICCYDKEARMLDVHHRDGDRSNNRLSNLEILCVWCHALRTRRVGIHEWNGRL